VVRRLQHLRTEVDILVLVGAQQLDLCLFVEIPGEEEVESAVGQA
jgi:hypothetical protein